MRIFYLAIIATLFLTACASQGPYKAANGSGYGYSETTISDNQYRIHFKARGENQKRAMDYATLRAAELTLLKGYDWFVIVSRDTIVEADNSNIQATTGTQRVVSRDCGLLTCNTTVREEPTRSMGFTAGDGGNTETALEIRMGKGVRPASGDSYDALEVRENLGDKA